MPFRNRIRPLWVWIGVGCLCVVLFFATVVVYDMPGGIADWRMSQELGLDATLRIPLGKSPEDAVQRFRHFPSMQVVHREPLDGGALLFSKRFLDHEYSDLHVDFARKMWFGWKWVWGGGYTFGEGTAKPDKSVVNYMVMPKVKNSPFPMVFGDIRDLSVQSISVATEGTNAGKYTAKLVSTAAGRAIWFAILPSSAKIPYEIQIYDQMGELMVHKTISDPHGSGSIDIVPR